MKLTRLLELEEFKPNEFVFHMVSSSPLTTT